MKSINNCQSKRLTGPDALLIDTRGNPPPTSGESALPVKYAQLSLKASLNDIFNR